MRLTSIDGTERVVGYTPPTQSNHQLATAIGFYEPDLMGDLERALLSGILLLAVVGLLLNFLLALLERRFTRWRRGLKHAG